MAPPFGGLNDNVPLHSTTDENSTGMPTIGLGTWQATPEQITTAINAALKMGYRHIDTAAAYENEEAIGNVLQEWFSSGKLSRSDLFITTKLPTNGMRPEYVSSWVSKSLQKLKVDYLDCYLIHCPIGCRYTGKDEEFFPVTKDGRADLDSDTNLVGIWKAMEAEVEAGRIRTIGVSNFNTEQMARVNASAKKCKIAVLQVELHNYLQQKETLKFCKENQIVVMSFATLGSPGSPVHHPGTGIVKRGLPPLIENPTVQKIAHKHRVTPAQVLLRFWTEKGVVVIPKSVTPARIQLNYQIFNFALSPEEQADLESMDLGEDGRLFKFDFFPGLTDHPEYPYTK